MKRMGVLLAGAALLGAPATAPGQSTAAEPEPSAIAEGARVWADNCTRCHTPRPSSERTDREWLTIVAHMRARANLTRTDALAVATFLQATNSPRSTPTAATDGPADASGSPEADGEVDGAAREGDTLPRDAATRRVIDAIESAGLTDAEWRAVLEYLRAVQAARKP